LAVLLLQKEMMAGGLADMDGLAGEEDEIAELGAMTPGPLGRKDQRENGLLKKMQEVQRSY